MLFGRFGEIVMCIAEQRKWIEALSGAVYGWELEEINDPVKLEDAFSRNLNFGTGGIRGLMGIGPNRMNILTVGKSAQGLSSFLIAGVERSSGHLGVAPMVAIAYDTRLHSRDFARETARVLAANGIRVLLFSQPQPTPVLSFATRALRCDCGVCITASHNPREYNGFKVYGPTGDQATDALAVSIQSEIEKVDTFTGVADADFDVLLESGMISPVPESAVDDYFSALLGETDGHSCPNLHVVYSPLGGTGRTLAERLFKKKHIEYALVESQLETDGEFVSCPKPNPENPAAMALGMRVMADENADLFLATDPDADRVGVAYNDHGTPRLLSGNDVGIMLLSYLGESTEGEARPRVAYTSVVSDPLADKIANACGFELRRTLTGFKYIGEQIDILETQGAEDSFLFGFEESCGYLKGAYVRDKDGINALALVCEMTSFLKTRGLNLGEYLSWIRRTYGYSRGRQVSYELSGAAGRARISAIMSEFRKADPAFFGDGAVASKVDYSMGAPMPVTRAGNLGGDIPLLPPSNMLEFVGGDGCKVIIRPSGTEPKLKCYLFASAASDGLAVEKLNHLEESVRGEIDKALSGAQPGGAHLVLLSGGSGSRLWPLSNSTRSKQFLKVLRNEDGEHVSMVQRVFSQISHVGGAFDITIATSEHQVASLLSQVPGDYSLVAEPSRRDTAPAIMLACEHLALEQGASDDDVVVVMPIDTYAEQEYYDSIPKLIAAVEQGGYDLVLLGVEPTYPSEKYGYIIPSLHHGTDHVDPVPVETFKEKPSESAARKFISAGALWNCGVFGFKLGYLRNITRRHLRADHFGDYVAGYDLLPKRSFDYEVVEHAARVAVIAYSGMWKDLGTWNTLTDEMADQSSGLVFLDAGTCNGVHVVNETALPVVVAGLRDAVVAATPDGILVTGKEESAHIKDLVTLASRDEPMCSDGQWGSSVIVRPGDKGVRDIGSIERVSISKFETYEGEVCYSNRLVVLLCDGSGVLEAKGLRAELEVGASVVVEPGSPFSFVSRECGAELLLTVVR